MLQNDVQQGCPYECCCESDKVAFMCRLQAWFRPHNPGMTAAEALCAPFFTAVINPEPNGDEAV